MPHPLLPTEGRGWGRGRGERGGVGGGVGGGGVQEVYICATCWNEHYADSTVTTHAPPAMVCDQDQSNVPSRQNEYCVSNIFDQFGI